MAKGSGTMKVQGRKQTATNARFIENMNEAQLDKEISKAERTIERAEKVTAAKNDIANHYSGGVGGIRPEQRKAFAKNNETAARQAQKYTDAQQTIRATKAYLGKLNKAKKAVKGTGKTVSEINAEKSKNFKSKAKWTTKRETTPYGNQVRRTSGKYTIFSSDGHHSLFVGDTHMGTFSRLSDAQGIAERNMRMG